MALQPFDAPPEHEVAPCELRDYKQEQAKNNVADFHFYSIAVVDSD